MHAEAWQWLEAQIRPRLVCAARALDIGGYDVNGSPRALFTYTTEYCVLDTRAGANVDIVADAVTWTPSRDLRGAFDVTVCTEVFEHVQHWRAIVYNLWLTLKPGGTCLITCATHPRPAHSIVGLEPPPADEWYANVPADDILPVLHLLFRQVESSRHPRGDFYAKCTR